MFVSSVTLSGDQCAAERSSLLELSFRVRRPGQQHSVNTVQSSVRDVLWPLSDMPSMSTSLGREIAAGHQRFVDLDLPGFEALGTVNIAPGSRVHKTSNRPQTVSSTIQKSFNRICQSGAQSNMLRNANLRDLPITAGNTVPSPVMKRHTESYNIERISYIISYIMSEIIYHIIHES